MLSSSCKKTHPSNTYNLFYGNISDSENNSYTRFSVSFLGSSCRLTIGLDIISETVSIHPIPYGSMEDLGKM